jgi:hypothetical protein
MNSGRKTSNESLLFLKAQAAVVLLLPFAHIAGRCYPALIAQTKFNLKPAQLNH